MRETHTELLLKPVAFKGNPENPVQLKDAMRGILNGLAFLHQYGYVHRDLRWPNIIREQNGNVRIIDLEHAGLEGVVGFDLDTWPEEAEVGKYTKHMDMSMLYTMGMQYIAMISDSREALDFLDQIKQGTPARQALQHPWLLQ